jgi:phenylpropionate dioxygenase-like ring-hydroxylating dioxygenase large terminal subunit
MPPASKPKRLSQFWHPIASVEEVTDQPQRFTLLDQHLVAFRTDAGISVFKDLCIHRGAALSLGEVKNGCIVCPYHGWEYDSTGACVKIPAQPDKPVPAAAHAIAYRVAEKYGVVWVALEEPIQDIPHIPLDLDTDPAYTSELFSILDWNTSAGRSTENSMDVSHFPFVHPNLLGDPDHPEQEPYDLHAEDWGQWFVVPNAFWRSVDQTQNAIITYTYTHVYPFTMHLHVTTEGSDDIISVMVIAAPTGAKKTRIFRIVFRNFVETNPNFVSDYLYILEQDRTVVESIRPEEIPHSLKEELHIKVPDQSSIAYRRWLEGVDTQGLAEV